MAETMTAMNEDEAFDAASEALNSDRAEEGLSILEPFLRERTSNYGLWHLHGLLLRQLNRRAEAIASLRRAATLAPASAKIAHALARTLSEAGLPAVEAYGRALQLAPGDQEVVMGLTSAFVAEGEPDTAISGLERIVARSPHWVQGHSLLSRLRWAQGERDRFTRSFDEALEVQPQNLDVRRAQLIALVHADRYEDVLAAVAVGRAAVGDHPLFDVHEAIAYSETGQSEKAEQLFAPLADTLDPTVQVRRVRMYLGSGRPEAADAVLSPWLQRPEAFMFWPYASAAWRMMGDSRWEWLEGDDRFVGIYDIADRLPPLDRLAPTLRKLHTLSGQPLEQSLRGGSQTDGDIFMHVDPVLIELREAIRRTVAEHVAQLPAYDETHPLLGTAREPISFSGAWSVWLRERGFHANHVHPVGWISSALYIVLPPDVGEAGSGVLTLGDPNSPTLKVDLQPFRTVEPKPGRLVLFPSYMWHGTRPFGQGERITIAFDVAVPRGRPGLRAAGESGI